MATAGGAGAVRARLALAAACLALVAHAPLLSNGFVNYDDPSYVTENPHVLAGPTPASIAWAFTHPLDGNWHPVTVLSHMADVALWGTSPAGHHATSLLVHALNAALLALLLHALSGRPWPALLGAALFAVHPLQVQSVAWVAERKNLLCAAFWLGSLLVWLAHARAPRPGRYAAALILAVLALASKPMAVTLPATLLLVDALVLERRRRPGETPGALARRLLLEKVPFLAAAAAIAAATVAAQSAEGNVQSAIYPAGVRLANAAVSAVWYLAKAVWPSGLAVFYPHPGASIEAWRVAGSALLLVAITWAALRAGRAAAVAWGFYLVTLLPVLGLVQAGAQARADRYAYVPLIGPFALAAFGAAGLAARSRAASRAVAALAAAAVLALSAGSVQAGRAWKDSIALFERSVAVSPDEPIALSNLGVALADAGRLDEAKSRLARAVELSPDDPASRLNLGNVLALRGERAAAEAAFAEAARLAPADPSGPYNLGMLLGGEGRAAEAEARFREALARSPAHARAGLQLAVLLLRRGASREAADVAARAVAAAPDKAESHLALALALDASGRRDEARREAGAAAALAPDDPAIAEAARRLGAGGPTP